MQLREMNPNALGRFRRPGFFFATIAAATVFAMATFTGSAAPYLGSESSDATQGVSMEQDDTADAHSLDEEVGDDADEQFIPGYTDVLHAELDLWWMNDDSGEQSQESAGLAKERFIPGVTDVLDAELDLWWLSNEGPSDHPEQPYPVGPYK